MGRNVVRMDSAIDGCAYLFDNDTKLLKRVCAVNAPEDIPDDVKSVIKSFGFAVRFQDVEQITPVTVRVRGDFIPGMV